LPVVTAEEEEEELSTGVTAEDDLEAGVVATAAALEVTALTMDETTVLRAGQSVTVAAHEVMVMYWVE
jgi:hypothetical protein